MLWLRLVYLGTFSVYFEHVFSKGLVIRVVKLQKQPAKAVLNSLAILTGKNCPLLSSVQEFNKIQGRLLLTFVIYLHNQLTLSVPEKMKTSIFEMPIIPQTLNINNSRITRAKYIDLHTIRKLIEYSLKNDQCLLLLFLRYWYPKVGRYYHPLSGVQGANGLKF